MLVNIYYSLAIIAYSIFLAQFILTMFGAVDLDTDFDINGDGFSDFSWGDIISFKGLIHFLMGSMGWLSLKSLTVGVIFWYDYLIAFGVGLLFFIILYWLYRLMMKLENKPKIFSGTDLIGSQARIYLARGKSKSGSYEYLITVNNGVGTIEYNAKSRHEYSVGDPVIVIDYQNGYYIL